MKFTSEIIKKAWAIRKEAAAKYGCPVSEISWKLSLQMAKAGKEETPMAAKIEARTGQESHTSNWGKFFVKGIEWADKEWDSDKHSKYCDGFVEIEDGKVFSVWDSSGNKRGTQESEYYICVSDSASKKEISGGCYDKSAWIKGNFKVLAHGSGKVKAPRLLQWVDALGGIEKITPEVAIEMEKQIDIRGRKEFQA